MAPTIRPTAIDPPIHAVRGTRIRIEAISSPVPAAYLPHGSMPTALKISMDSGAPVNLKNKVCSMVTAAITRATIENFFANIELKLVCTKLGFFVQMQKKQALIYGLFTGAPMPLLETVRYKAAVLNLGIEVFAVGPAHINGIEGFWGLAKTRLVKFKGLRPNYLLFTLERM